MLTSYQFLLSISNCSYIFSDTKISDGIALLISEPVPGNQDMRGNTSLAHKRCFSFPNSFLVYFFNNLFRRNIAVIRKNYRLNKGFSNRLDCFDTKDLFGRFIPGANTQVIILRYDYVSRIINQVYQSPNIF